MSSSDEVSYEQRLQLAMKAYQNNERNVSKRCIAREYGIAWSTFRDRLKGANPHRLAHTKAQRLTPEQEESLVHWALLMHKWGWPARSEQLRHMASELLKSQTSQDFIGVNWVQKFLLRHSELVSVFSQSLDSDRAAMHDRARLEGWFQLFEKTQREYDVQIEDTYNMDEKGFAMGLLGKHRVICPRGQRPTLTQDGNREWVSLIECACADGEVLSAWYIFKGKLHQKAWYEVLTEGHIAISDNGWTTNGIGLDWLKECFEKESRKR